MERTFVMVKPDGVQRKLAGKIITRFEERGFQLVGLKLMHITPELAAKHYAEHESKPFFQELVGFITSSPVVAMVWEGLEAVKTIRTMMGKTDPLQADPGTIRGDFALYMGNNIVHGSDSPESATREINLFFDSAELMSYNVDINKWINGE